jgi:hypothetical protein
MSGNWRQRYSELSGLLAQDPGIIVETSSIIIPERVRAEFYQLFDAVRNTFIEETSPNILEESKVLSENYLKAEVEVKKLIKLDDIIKPKPLAWFLEDPVDGLRRRLFDPLFDLLKGRLNIDTFERESSLKIEAAFKTLHNAGYGKWAAVSLIKLFKADRLLQIILRRVARSERIVIQASASLEQIPPPHNSEYLSFMHTDEDLLAVPDFIIHTPEIGRYIAIRSDYKPALATATNTSEDREWYLLDSVGVLEPGLIFIYIADNAEEISLVADAKKICRPDLILECRGQKGWYKKEGLKKIKVVHDSLKPILGTYVISKEPVPERESEKQEVDIHILAVGFDQSKLEPVTDALLKNS